MKSQGPSSTFHESINWYESEFERAQLTAPDVAWLEKLSGKSIDTVWLEEANSVVALGSVHLGKDTDPATFNEVVTARRHFYENLLGWADPNHSMHNAYKEVQVNAVQTIPLATTIGTQRVLHSAGIHNALACSRFPVLLGYAPDSVQKKLDTFNKVGLNAKDLVNEAPGVLSVAPDVVDRKIVVMTSLGLDSSKVVGKKPNNLWISEAKLKQRHHQLTELGLNASQVINWHPSLLSISNEALEEKFATIAELGIAPVKAVNKFPTILGLSEETLRNKVQFLKDHGISTTVIDRDPVILGLSSENIEDKIKLLQHYRATLNWHGGTVEELVEIFPGILKLSNSKLRFHARMFAKHGDPRMPAKDVRRLILRPAEVHLLTVVEGHPYTATSVARTYEVTPTADRKDLTLQAIDSPESIGLIGKRVLDAYMDYISPRGIPKSSTVSYRV